MIEVIKNEYIILLDKALQNNDEQIDKDDATLCKFGNMYVLFNGLERTITHYFNTEEAYNAINKFDNI